MRNSGIEKQATRIPRSFGDWALELEYSWSGATDSSRPATEARTGKRALPGLDNGKIQSRRAAAYWESRK